MNAVLHVTRGGPFTTVQDLGRPGHAHLAVPRSGALDVPAMRLANRLVGNQEHCAVLETTMGGVAFALTTSRYVAVTGASALIRVDGRAVDWAMPVLVRAGQTVDVGPAVTGLRSYVAVSGGVAVPEVLDSRATDVLSGLGPDVVRTGAVLPLGEPRGPAPVIDFAPYPLPGNDFLLDCHLGPRDDQLTEDAIETLHTATWTVSSRSNRIGIRLTGPELRRVDEEELPSEGLVLGSVQLPPSGQPVLFLADHPVTGGYPVVGVVPAPDIWRCAQAAPGTRIRFRTKTIRLS
jgi:biotin-dependent carboxylase-like uncharacterized protein